MWLEPEVSPGLYHFLPLADTKLNLRPEEKKQVHAIYLDHITRLSEEPSVNQQLRNKAKAELRNFTSITKSSEVTKFWNSKNEKSYRQMLDGHIRKEKEYLSSLHLSELQGEDSKGKEEEFENNEDFIMATLSNEAPGVVRLGSAEWSAVSIGGENL
ncbi:hypothetical protein BC936DRAFT_139306, partial [Jimgerdemannia flammicorona]